MIFWEVFWQAVLLVSGAAFAGLAIVVSVGGLSDIRAMLRSIEHHHDDGTESSDES